jgi:hypothetical protein
VELAAVGAHGQAVVEASRLEVAHVRLDRERLDPIGSQARVAATEARKVVDAGDLEPDEVDGVVRDALGIATPWASVSAKRTFTSVAKRNSTARTLYDR